MRQHWDVCVCCLYDREHVIGHIMCTSTHTHERMIALAKVHDYVCLDYRSRLNRRPSRHPRAVSVFVIVSAPGAGGLHTVVVPGG